MLITIIIASAAFIVLVFLWLRLWHSLDGLVWRDARDEREWR